MSHFSTDEWVDFTRGLLPPDKAAAMQASLNEGCSECISTFQLWQTILQSLPKEGEYEPSKAAIEAVRNAYFSETFLKWMVSAAKFARVVFDSFLEPAPAGVRSSGKSSRQITVETEPFVIDLHLESDNARQHTSLTGQVLNSYQLRETVRGADVVLLSTDSLMRRTKANEFGEFCLDFVQAKDLRLFINISGERAIGIVLPGLENG